MPYSKYITSFLFFFIFFQIGANAQIAQVNPPTSGFHIDGGLRANTPTANIGDWYPGAGGTGGSVFNEAGVPNSPATTQTSGKAIDAYNSNDNIFTTGSKFNSYISDLSWFTNSAPDKNDINNALYHVARDGSNNQWIFISGDRLSTNGTSYIDFELLQGTVTRNGTTSGGFTGTPVATKPNGGGRTQNDIIISMEYTNGGTKPNVYIYQWKLSGSTWSYQLVTGLSDLATNAFAETNRTGAELNLPSSFTAFGTNNYQQFAFVEAAINITYLLNQTGSACSGLNIQTLWVKTKASASSTAALKDFMDPIPVNFTFGNSSITPISAKCANDNTAYLLSATPSGGTFTGPGVSLVNGSYYFTPSAAGGAATKTINYSASGCTASTTITVTSLPAAPTVGVVDNCNGTSTLTVTGLGTGATITWTDDATNHDNPRTVASAGTYSVTQTVNGCTGAAGSGTAAPKTPPDVPTVGVVDNCNGTSTLTVTGIASGATITWTDDATNHDNPRTVSSAGAYSVTQTLNGCTSAAGSGTAAPKTTPAKPSVTYNPPACDEATFSVTVNSPEANAVYSILDKNGNVITGVTKPGGTGDTYTAPNTTSFNFDSIPAGSGYKVTVTNNGCPSSPNTCGVVIKTTARKIQQTQTIEKETASVTTVTAAPNPFNDRIRFSITPNTSGRGRLDLYNILGQKVRTIFEGQVQKDQVQTIEYSVPTSQRTNLIYYFSVGTSHTSGKLINLR